MKEFYEVTEEYWKGMREDVRTARVEKRDSHGYCYDVGRITLPHDIFDKIRAVIETLTYEEE